MTDDEAFIRAIVDAPGDEAPRLVYADWLDEREDLRGTFVRAEVEWARKRKKHFWSIPGSLTALANTLDSVWVARIARPPVGVCSDRFRFADRGPALTPTDVREAERRLGTEVSSEYRAFLVNINGGRPDWAEFRPQRGQTELTVERFLSVASAGAPLGAASDLEGVLAKIRALGGDASQQVIPIATVQGNGYLVLGVSGSLWGRVLHLPYLPGQREDLRQAEPLTRSFADFLVLLALPREAWTRMIREGDVEGFTHWLDSGGSPDGHGYSADEDPLRIAIRHTQPAIVGELLAHGAKLTHGALEDAAASAHPEIVALLRGAWERLPDMEQWAMWIPPFRPDGISPSTG